MLGMSAILTALSRETMRRAAGRSMGPWVALLRAVRVSLCNRRRAVGRWTLTRIDTALFDRLSISPSAVIVGVRALVA